MHKRGVRYGASAAESVDIFPAEPTSGPIILYFHGGAWKSGSEQTVSFPAAVFQEIGVTYIAVGFDHVPAVSLEEQVRQARAAVAWTYRHASTLPGDRDRLYVAGHSSGGHLVGMLLSTDWRQQHGLPPDIIKGALVMSGVFDLEPVRHTWRNRYLHLSRSDARRLSPIHHIPSQPIDLVVAYGTGELDEFQRQSQAFAEAWQAAGHSCTLLPLEGRNHYEVGFELENYQSPVVASIRAQMAV